MTLDLTQIQDSRIAEYSFGRVINAVGLNIFRSTNARLGKKLFGNDPDPLKEVVLDDHSEIVRQWIADHPGGPVDTNQDVIFGLGDTLQVHHRTVMFGSTWKSDSLRPANKSFLYHDGAYTHFRFPGLARMTSMEEDGICVCSGFENRSALHRTMHVIDGSMSYTPSKVGTILVPLKDAWYHNTKMRMHFPFVVSELDTIKITSEEPNVLIEFTEAEPNVAEFLRSWLDQVERGLIEIVDRVYE
jgi:hypothetical protein